MALKGSAFIFMWHDIVAGQHGAYREWHTREHMFERLSIPGFLVGKRLYAADAARHVFGTVYAGTEVEVFRSPAYLARLNHPTPWTSRIAPSFQHMLRVAFERIATAGAGDGGSMATLRFSFNPAQDVAQAAAQAAETLRQQGQALVQAVQALPGVACAHLGLARSDVSGVRTRETELRGDGDGKAGEKPLDAVLLVEGFGREALQAALPQVRQLAQATHALDEHPVVHVYDVEYALDGSQLDGSCALPARDRA